MDDKECLRNVVSYRNSTSNHNFDYCSRAAVWLYLIEILHQTTTPAVVTNNLQQLYLIEILHQTTTTCSPQAWSFLLYLIEILHQTTTILQLPPIASSLYLIEILHQTTTPFSPMSQKYGCILSKFYIKPQLDPRSINAYGVVSYRNSTSNHNKSIPINFRVLVVSYRNSTSNHNEGRINLRHIQLYLIEILHQTTTSGLILIDKVLLTGCLPL